jgi:hypothetical protein
LVLFEDVRYFSYRGLGVYFTGTETQTNCENIHLRKNLFSSSKIDHLTVKISQCPSPHPLAGPQPGLHRDRGVKNSQEILVDGLQGFLATSPHKLIVALALALG